MFAFAHVHTIRKSADITAAANHAVARDKSAKKRRRKGFTGPRTLGGTRDRSGKWRFGIIYPDDHPQAPALPDGEFPTQADYPTAFKAHLKRNNARQAKNAHAGMHMIVGVSSEYFDDEEHGRAPGDPDYKGDKHHPNGPAVRKLTTAAINWAESELGGVWAARYDVDEKGGAIVDVLCSPIRPHGKTGRNWISIRKAQAEIKQQYPFAAKGYGAMQSSWADYATEHLGATFLRGRPKAETGREHLIAEQYGEALDAGRQMVAELEDKAGRLATQIKHLSETVKELQAQRDRLTARLKKTLAAVSGLGSRLTAWAVSRYRAASRPSLPPDPEHEELADQAVEVAVALAASVDTATPPERHRERLHERVRRKRMQRGWGDDDPEGPLGAAWLAGTTHVDGSERMDYEDWRHALAHASARGADPDHRDLIRLARRVEKSLGRYQTRDEQRRRRPTGKGLGR